MKKAVLVFIVIFSACVMSAQSLEKVYTNDGNIYYGYISSQIPGKEISVKTTAANIFSDKVEIKNSSVVPFSKLDKGWKDFLKDNQEYVSDTSRIFVADVKIDEQAASK